MRYDVEILCLYSLKNWKILLMKTTINLFKIFSILHLQFHVTKQQTTHIFMQLQILRYFSYCFSRTKKICFSPTLNLIIFVYVDCLWHCKLCYRMMYFWVFFICVPSRECFAVVAITVININDYKSLTKKIWHLMTFLILISFCVHNHLNTYSY